MRYEFNEETGELMRGGKPLQKVGNPVDGVAEMVQSTTEKLAREDAADRLQKIKDIREQNEKQRQRFESAIEDVDLNDADLAAQERFWQAQLDAFGPETPAEPGNQPENPGKPE